MEPFGADKADRGNGEHKRITLVIVDLLQRERPQVKDLM
jgi:hypothetical protein